MQAEQGRFQRGLLAWADGVTRHARSIVWGNLALSLILAAYAAMNLGVNADNMRLLDPDLPFQQAAAGFQENFSSLDDSLLIVIDARSGTQAQESADLLAAALAEQTDLFTGVFEPGSGGFFERHGLLYRSPDDLEAFADQMAAYQPILAELSRDPSLMNLTSMLERGFAEGVGGDESATEFSGIFDRIGDASVEVFAEYPVAVSWQDLMMEGSAIDPGSRRVVIAEPILDFEAVLAASPAMESIRSTAQDLGLVADRGIELRITGNPALSVEEMIGLFWDVGVSGILSFMIVLVAIFFAFGSARLSLAAGATLVVGLVWTAAFAAATVGALNLISIAFAVLFIGLGVDFSIHLGMHFVAGLRAGLRPGEALQGAGREVGSSLILCTFTTAIGFYSFVPTDYLGVAELGLISGTGMFVILIQTVTFFPALSTLLVGSRGKELFAKTSRFQFRVPAAVTNRPEVVVSLALLLGIVGVFLAPGARFDSDVVEMRDPRTESVEAFKDLLEDPRTSPWYIDAVADNLEEAEVLAARFEELPEVSEAITVRAYVPEDQTEKLEILADTSMLFDVPRSDRIASQGPTVEEQIAAIRDLQRLLTESTVVQGDSTLALSGAKLNAMLGEFLAKVGNSPDPTEAVNRFEELLLGSFPDQFRRLQLALDPDEVRLETLPANLRERMLAPNGKARVQVFPSGNLGEGDAREIFVDAIRQVQPDATGVAVNLIEFGRATARSLVEALSLALILITVLLLLIWRKPLDAALVLLPLILAGVMTGAAMVVLDRAFNFANVIVLPLLLGIGVDSGVHLVHRAREAGRGKPLLESVTAQAVFWSALTTIVSFGSLALSAHRGIASLGLLLVVGLTITVLANLILLPALVVLVQRRGYLLPPAQRS
ncbi:MAG: MMPL family transporter [Candidatus Binatia bacterium]|nr:MMPL family transporter [Candidatus Binatia bacterium]